MAKGKIAAFLEKDTAGIPNWGWLAIIVVGIGAAYILPKFLSTSSSTPDQTSTDSGTSNSDLGLAIDPTTGLPYAVEGLVPSGGTSASSVDLSETNSLLQQLLAAQQAQNGTAPTTVGAGSGTTSTASSSNSSTNTNPIEETYGLLGSAIDVNFKNRTYLNSAGQWVPIPISQSATLVAGSQGRVWYVENGIQYLLTAGQGPAVTNSGYPVNSPQNTPGAYNQGTKAVQGPLIAAQPFPATEVAAASKTGGSTGAASNAHFNVPGPGVGWSSFVDRVRARFSTVPKTSGTMGTNNGNVNVSNAGQSVSVSNGNVSVTGPEGDINITNGRFNPVGSWPFQETSFQQFASSRGMSFQRLMELNPNLYNSDRIVSGQQMRLS